MSDYREPPHTCPDIDRILRTLKDLASEIEDIRAANLKIREWGSAWQERAEDAEKEAAAWERKADEFESELLDARAEASELKRLLDDRSVTA